MIFLVLRDKPSWVIPPSIHHDTNHYPIAKDPSGKRPVSPLALEEAGCMTVCRSAAWGAKMVTSAWWVYADQVRLFL